MYEYICIENSIFVIQCERGTAKAAYEKIFVMPCLNHQAWALKFK